MSKIETGTDGTIRLSQDYPARENPQLTDAIMVGDVESGTVSSTTAGNIKTLYTGSIAENNDGFVTGGDVAAALALKPDSDDVSAALDTKVDKVEDMGLSHEDYTAPEKDDLATLSMFYKPVNDALDGINGQEVRGGMPAKLDKISESKTKIRRAIETKGVDMSGNIPLSEFPAQIEKIDVVEKLVGEWYPHPDWWDIEMILENDTDASRGKVISLIPETDPTIELPAQHRYMTSDGKVYENGGTHTWETSPSDIYKKRWIIAYDYVFLPQNALYAIFSDIAVPQSIFASHKSLQSFRLINGAQVQYAMTGSYYTGAYRLFFECASLAKIPENMELPDAYVDYTNAFYQCSSLRSLPKSWVFKVQTVNEAFTVTNMTSFPPIILADNCYGSTRFNSATKFIDLDIRNITRGGMINFDYCTNISRSSLIRILNNLVDNSGNDTYTLSIGTYNLQKLTEEEKAIATDKNWKLA